MSCRRITRWVLRHGTADVPAEWHDHIVACAACRRAIDDVKALDTALSRSNVPDPGEAYWEGFAPSVARRLEAQSGTSQQTTTPSRWRWVRVWAPVAGVAVLALLMGRELTRDYAAKPVILDSDVVVDTERPMENEVIASPDATPSTPTDNVRSAVADRTAESQPARSKLKDENSGPTMRAVGAAPLETERGIATESADDSPDFEDAQSASPDLSESTNDIDPARNDDSDVWPDRRVLTLGQLGQDAGENPTMEDNRLGEQNSPATVDRRALWAESSGTPSALARLEGTRAFRSATLPDSQSPTEAMRRFDELVELRQQITAIEETQLADRTPAQSRELCAMWYRTGQITLDPVELETAIQRMDECIMALDDTLKEEWQNKKSQLVNRRASLDR